MDTKHDRVTSKRSRGVDYESSEERDETSKECGTSIEETNNDSTKSVNQPSSTISTSSEVDTRTSLLTDSILPSVRHEIGFAVLFGSSNHISTCNQEQS